VLGSAVPPFDVAQDSPELLRWAVKALEDAQRERVAYGEQLRAIIQGRVTAVQPEEPVAGEPAAILKAIARGRALGPVPVLGTLYHQRSQDERHYAKVVDQMVRSHPTWPWLAEVRGIGTRLAGRLLARLRVERAPTPSSFWAYCGLHTVPAQQFRCDDCGVEVSLGAREVSTIAPLRQHRPPSGDGRCGGRLRALGEPSATTRQAARYSSGSSARYNREARSLCHIVGTSLLRRGRAYRAYYAAQKAALVSERPEWSTNRRHLGALRRTEKRFLAHLWLVWREAVGLPLTAPHFGAGACTDGPWQMVE
jgi:hypothetical protein